MRCFLRKLLILLCVAVLLVCSAFTAFADGTVIYDGTAQKFIFEPGSNHSPTDLFTDFKNVMPGDSITQKIEIRNDVSKEVKIKLYMRSLGAQDNTDRFLSQMNLSVAQDGDSILFDAPSDQTAQLTDWVYLGTIYSGGKIVLNVTLDVPITMGNEFQHNIGYIDWQFKVEERPVEPGDPEPPKTGDGFDIILYIALMVASLIAFIALLLFAKKKNRRQ